ncbi:MAG: hypothetical protein QG671_825 [Actinomycetota bacterium]|nr:hypothetical protein [Actinomycetota bacterium]
MSRLRPRAVCVFCAASEAIDDRYRELAAQVGAELGRRRLELVSGGGRVSSMGALVRAARLNGSRTVGVIPSALMGWEVADTESDELVVTDGMRDRKAQMDRRSDAFLVLPGGIGTLEEFLEAWVARSLGLHRKPIVVLDPWQDFAALRALLEHLVAAGFTSAVVAAEVHWATTPAAALDVIEAAWQAGEGRSAALPDRPVGRPEVELELEAD